jgi:hypothetical protein
MSAVGISGISAGEDVNKTGDRAVDESRIHGVQGLVIQTEIGQRADLEVLDEHIRAGRQIEYQSATLRRAQIGDHRALAAITAMKIGRITRFAIDTAHEGRAPAARIVAFGGFDLDDIGAFSVGAALTLAQAPATGAAPDPQARMAQLAKDLSLSDAQKPQFQQILDAERTRTIRRSKTPRWPSSNPS